MAAQVGCSVTTARTWGDRFAVRGIPGIFDQPRSGRPPVHGPSARLAVLATATGVPPQGESCWSHVTIARHRPPAACRSRRPRSAACSPRRPCDRTGCVAGSTAPTTRRSGPRPARPAASTWTRRREPCWSASTRRPAI
ncbi:hypothetical protein [Frankia sp. Cppng1_Ct_nod]|uniref:hypothetical protein n=1 Tax=Frankia sp. Cppng1_Ct_nod TaxID=2897162 RepID=UPI0032E9EA97